MELFGGRNGVIFYGADGYSTTQVNTGEIFYKGGTTYFIVGTSSLLPGPYQTNLRNATVTGSTTVNSAIVSKCWKPAPFRRERRIGQSLCRDLLSESVRDHSVQRQSFLSMRSVPKLTSDSNATKLEQVL